MVIYELLCEAGHHFEGWFKDAKSFESQNKRGLVQCSFCGIDRVHRVPSGCHVGGIVAQSVEQKPLPALQKEVLTRVDSRKSPETVGVDPVLFLKAMQKHVKENYKDVGDQFADLAIQMQKGKTANESIYGTATPDDRERLDDEGVSYIPLPKLPESVEN